MKSSSAIAYAIVVDTPKSLAGLVYADDAGTKQPPNGILVIAPGTKNSKPYYFDSATGALIPESSLYQGETPVWTTFGLLPGLRVEPSILQTSAGVRRR